MEHQWDLQTHDFDTTTNYEEGRVFYPKLWAFDVHDFEQDGGPGGVIGMLVQRPNNLSPSLTAPTTMHHLVHPQTLLSC